LRVQMRVEISKLHQELGNTMIYVTHDQVEAMTMAAKIVVLRDGNVVQVGTPLELYNRPKNIFVAGFIGSPRMNLFSVRLTPAVDGFQFSGETVRFDTVLSAVEPEAPVCLGVRPEHIIVGGADGQSLCQARVHLVEHLGGATVIYATAPDGTSLTIAAPGQAGVHQGDLVPLRVHPALCHLFRENGTALPSI
jgi:multiple sugar transport system ATP-binding protein